jgi:hypothetical protein
MTKARELAERYLALAQDHGCGDGGCVIFRPSGMHTNGGCRCARRMSTTDEIYVRRLLAVAQELATEISTMKDRDEARAEPGYDQGYNEGFEEGYDLGLRKATQEDRAP